MLVRIKAEELQCQQDEKKKKKYSCHIERSPNPGPQHHVSLFHPPTTSTSLADAEALNQIILNQNIRYHMQLHIHLYSVEY